MAIPQVAESARNFAVMVRIKGPDPKGLKMRSHAFHQYHSGKTTLSASGMLLPDNLLDVCKLGSGESGLNLVPGCAVVVTVASILEPFMTMESKGSSFKARPKLIPGTEIDVMVEGGAEAECRQEDPDEGAAKWFRAEILRLVDVPAAASAIDSLIGASSDSLEHSWEVGWSLASHANSQKFTNTLHKAGKDASSNESNRHLAVAQSGNPYLMARATTRIAFLQLPALPQKDLPKIIISPCSKRGDALLAMGSPFGILSPVHFLNSVSLGSVSNSYSPTLYDGSLLMADIRCLPGMEGCPVFGDDVNLIGLLTRPLRQTGGAEIQLVIPWKAIEAACIDINQPTTQILEQGLHFVEGTLNDWGRTKAIRSKNTWELPVKRYPLASPLMQAMASVCLITMNNGVWASGVLLNDEGLILTNAHLLEPWRFGRTTVRSDKDGTRVEKHPLQYEDSAAFTNGSDKDNIDLLQPISEKTEFTLDLSSKEHEIPNYRSHTHIRVRLFHAEELIWCNAKVLYVSRGPLDVSLLQLESVPHNLCSITADFSCPLSGSKAFVIGHGLFGPRSGLLPSICSGVIAKVVKVMMPLTYTTSLAKDTAGKFPAMLETTAAVHPGGSGGAIVNSNGHLIGLVTSNARHGGGTVIPHMNFSIPCAALEPIFKFSKDTKNLSLLKELEKPNKELLTVWALIPLPPEPGPALPNVRDLLLKDGEKQGKGSRFAKFVAERQELFKGSSQLETSKRLSPDIILSKL